MSIATNIKKIYSNIPSSAIIVAATKSRTLDETKEAIDAGIKIIGENYVQDAVEKYEEFNGKVKFHCIGHLQTNKVKKAVELFDCIQTVDSLNLAEEINKQCEKINKTMPIMIEINIAEEPEKTGCAPNNAEKLCSEIIKLKNLKLTGLMTMAPYFDDTEKTRPYFIKMKEIYNKLKDKYNLAFLSMGMSNSYQLAIEEGSNMIRVGTAIFGKRS